MTIATTTGLRAISLICVGTTEPDRAIAFYESIGFEKRVDTPFEGKYRWIEVYLPGGSDRDRTRAAAAGAATGPD